MKQAVAVTAGCHWKQALAHTQIGPPIQAACQRPSTHLAMYMAIIHLMCLWIFVETEHLHIPSHLV